MTLADYQRAVQAVMESSGDTMFELARIVERQALERAAKVCDEVSVDRWNLYKGRAPYTGSEDGRASAAVQGESDGADACAAKIRALLETDK